MGKFNYILWLIVIFIENIFFKLKINISVFFFRLRWFKNINIILMDIKFLILFEINFYKINVKFML